MPNIVIAGAQWGDEGKGKVVDLLTRKVQVVARYNGGHNAGHTVIVGRPEVHPPRDPLRASCTRASCASSATGW